MKAGDMIVVEFLRNQRWFAKTKASEFNERRKAEYAEGKIDMNRYVVALYDTEKEADDYIKANKENMERFCFITTMDDQSYFI